jgi:multidrug efflux pump subunit AcrA (membrane-fusion protein)
VKAKRSESRSLTIRETFSGKVAYVCHIDPQTRTNKVRLEFANPHSKLKPGMYANSEIVINLGDTLTVPATAVLRSGLRQQFLLIATKAYWSHGR